MTTSPWDDINGFLEPSCNYEFDAELKKKVVEGLMISGNM
jgi:hypothetical protein